MAYTRTKKLTDISYAPTNPVTEAAARAVVDDSIDELNVAYGSDAGAGYVGESHGGSVQDRLDYIDGELVTISQGSVADGSISTAKLADSAVTADKIASDAVVTAKIDDDAVTSDKILDGAIINAKLAANAVTTAKILDDAVTTDKIAANTITDSNMATAMKKGMPGGLAAYNDQKFVKIKEYTSVANGVAQVNLDMTDVNFSLYAKVIVCVRDIYRTTAGTSGLLLLVNGSSASNYHYTYFGRGSAGGIAYQASQNSFNSTGSGLDLSDTVSEKIDVELFAAGNCIYANIASAEWMIYGKYDVGSTATITALNIATPLGDNLIKSGVKFYAYGVLK